MYVDQGHRRLSLTMGAAAQQPAKAADREKTWHAYAASFYESVTLRQASARCADGEQSLAVLDVDINAFNDLLATKCGG
jgi:hypothetical protein